MSSPIGVIQESPRMAVSDARTHEVTFCSSVSKWSDSIFEKNPAWSFKRTDIEQSKGIKLKRSDLRVYQKNGKLISVLLAAFAPVLVLFLAIFWDRRQRKHTEKPPQPEKLLRPPGYSLSIRLENTFESFLDNTFAACSLSAFSAIGIFTLAGLLGLFKLYQR
jgi:hypothetical protein